MSNAFIVSSLLLFIGSVAGCKSAPAFDQQSAIATIDSILKIQEDAYDQNTETARNTLQSTCEDSLMFIGGDGGGLVRSAHFYVHDLADGYAKRPYDRTYRVTEHTAIVSSLQQTFKVFGNDTIYFNARSTKVFIKENGQWKMSLVTFAPLPVFYFSQHTVPATLLANYTGIYKTGEHTADSVFVKEGQIFIAASDGGASPLKAINDSTFLGEGYFGLTVFSGSRQGSISQMYYEYPDGERIFSRKIR